MLNKYTLYFKDKAIEDQYQEYITNTIRKPLLLKITLMMIFWYAMNLLQLLIEESFDIVPYDELLKVYLPLFSVVILFFVVYFCMPQYSRWALFIANHIYAMAYCYENFKGSIEQYKFVTFLLVGLQFVSLMSAECIEMIFQVIAFTIIYLTVMLVENTSYFYCNSIVGVLTGVVMLLGLHNNTRKMRSQFQLRFIDDQWEQIFISLNESCLIFYYDEETTSFNYRKSNNFFDQISDSKTLRDYLRQAKINDCNFENFLFQKLQLRQNLVKQLINIGISKNNEQQSYYSIFNGVRPVIILQIQNMTQSCDLNTISQEFEKRQRLQMKKLFSILFNKNNKAQLMRLKRLCIYQNIQGCLNDLLEKKTKFDCSIQVDNILRKIKRLYPEKKILIDCSNRISWIQNNKYMIFALFLGTIERMISQEIFIELRQDDDNNISIILQGYYVESSFQFLFTSIKSFSSYVINFALKNFSNYSNQLQQSTLLQSIEKLQNDLQYQLIKTKQSLSQFINDFRSFYTKLSNFYKKFITKNGLEKFLLIQSYFVFQFIIRRRNNEELQKISQFRSFLLFSCCYSNHQCI